MTHRITQLDIDDGADLGRPGARAQDAATRDGGSIPPGSTGVLCEVYSRVVGYLRPVASWHAAKQWEFGERVPFDPTFYVDDGGALHTLSTCPKCGQVVRASRHECGNE